MKLTTSSKQEADERFEAEAELVALFKEALPTKNDPATVGRLIAKVYRHYGKASLKSEITQLIAQSNDQMALARYFGITDWP